jgi:hypothetical protein
MSPPRWLGNPYLTGDRGEQREGERERQRDQRDRERQRETETERDESQEVRLEGDVPREEKKEVSKLAVNVSKDFARLLDIDNSGLSCEDLASSF